MKHFLGPYPPGSTPLDPNEIDGLIPDYISTQGELNQLEQENILTASVWVKSRARRDALTEKFVRELHKKMFGEVWRWAGQFRLSDKSIGVDWRNIPVEMKKLLDDARFWIANHTYSPDEIGARFHHRLVCVHMFPNGNGRHARLMTDVLLAQNDAPPFSWGVLRAKSEIEADKEVRAEYIMALREADERRMERLLRFVRS